MPKTRFGDTTPYFNIAKEFGVDYGDVLALADLVTHGRASEPKPVDLGLMWPPVARIMNKLHLGRTREFDVAMADQLARFREIQAGAPY